MTPERWQQVKDVFERTIEREPAERRAFVDDACAGDDELRDEVTSLLDQHERIGGFSVDTPTGAPGRGATSAPDLSALDTEPLPEAPTPAKVCPRCKAKFDASAAVCPHDGELLDDDPEALVGVVLDGLYQVERVLGRGGMGVVYLARHVLLRDLVAIKTLRPGAGLGAQWVQRFVREGRAARAIRHPNAVTVHEMRTSPGGFTYMVMEYVDGVTLRARLKRRSPTTLGEVLGVLEPVASALDEAHACGVVHRDLKPENIMIGTSGGHRVVKLMDLGVAKLREAADATYAARTELTMPGQAVGTPLYMSPEQWGHIPRDGGTEIDGRADVYSLGLILYEMLAGRRAFEGETTADLRRAHLRATPPPLDEVAEAVPAAVSEVVARAMAKDRGDRQATPGQVMTELRAAMGEADPLTTAGASGARARSVGLKALVALLAVGVLAVALATRAPRATSVEPAPQNVEQRRPRFAYSFLLGECRRDGTEAGSLDQIAGDEAAIFRTGEGLRLRMVPNSSGYLYIFNEAPAADGRDPKLTVLYPEADPSSGRALATDAVFEYPEPESRALLCFDQGSGTEVLYLVFADAPVPELEAVRAAFNTAQMGAVTDPAQAQAIRELLARYPVGSYDADRDLAARQTTVRAAGPVTVVRLSLEHRKGR